jgi:hypothetical protein
LQRQEARWAGESRSVIEIEGIDDNTTNAFTFAQTDSASGFDPDGNQPALVFLRHENEYRLSQIWESTTVGRELPARWGTKRIGRAAEPAGGGAYVIEAERILGSQAGQIGPASPPNPLCRVPDRRPD